MWKGEIFLRIRFDETYQTGAVYVPEGSQSVPEVLICVFETKESTYRHRHRSLVPQKSAQKCDN